MNQPSLPFFTSNRCPDLKAPSDIALRVHGNMGSRKKEPVEARATRWISQHPQIEALFQRYALKAANTGRRHYSAKAIVELIRWNEEVEGGRPFKIANFVTPYLALRFMDTHPECAGIFKSNKQKSN